MPASMRLIFVKHGQYSTYDILVQRCQLIQDVEVRWDRRLGGDRRLRSIRPVDADRRRVDRRRPVDRDAALRGYTVADLPDATA